MREDFYTCNVTNGKDLLNRNYLITRSKNLICIFDALIYNDINALKTEKSKLDSNNCLVNGRNEVKFEKSFALIFEKYSIQSIIIFYTLLSFAKRQYNIYSTKHIFLHLADTPEYVNLFRKDMEYCSKRNNKEICGEMIKSYKCKHRLNLKKEIDNTPAYNKKLTDLDIETFGGLVTICECNNPFLNAPCNNETNTDSENQKKQVTVYTHNIGDPYIHDRSRCIIYKEDSQYKNDTRYVVLDLDQVLCPKPFNIPNELLFCNDPKYSEFPLRKYNVVVGGTFDRMHEAHKMLLSVAYALCLNRVLVGICSSKMVSEKKLSQCIDNYDTRLKNVSSFFNLIGHRNIQVDIQEINDPLGSAKDDPDPNLGIIVVSVDTIKGAILVNKAREMMNLRPLRPVILPIIPSKNLEISSTELRINAFEY